MKRYFLIFIILLTTLVCYGAKNQGIKKNEAKDPKELISEIDKEVKKIDNDTTLKVKQEQPENSNEPIVIYYYYDNNRNVKKIIENVLMPGKSEQITFYLKNGKIIYIVTGATTVGLPDGEEGSSWGYNWYLNAKGNILGIENLSQEEQNKRNNNIPKPFKFKKKI